MIMGIVLTEIITVGLSLGLELKNLFNFFRRVANNGYVLDVNKFEEFKKNNQSKLMDRFFWTYVPVINVLNSIRRSFKYNNISDDNIIQLCNHECIRKMTVEEFNMYNENPNGILALAIPLITEKQKSIFCGKYTEENNNNKYYVEFDLDSKTGEVTIKSIKIDRCNLSLNEIKDNIRKTFREQKYSQNDRHNLDLKNVSLNNGKKEEVKKENNSPYYVANYEIKKGNVTIARELTQQGFDDVSRIMIEDLELLEENDGPKLRL